MNTIRKFVYAALLAATAVQFATSTAMAQERARGKFTLTHDVIWANTTVPAGEYVFSYDPYEPKPVLTLTKMDGRRAGFMLLIASADASKGSDSNRLLLETTPEGSYVAAMQLPECGMTLSFSVPAHAGKQLAKSLPTVASSGQE
ncbi:MAG TPA: hypothetical protein VMU05_11685 [Dongiaceae bacterium]|nr:hypothetical protein [Dongiaceae bacterium]